MATATYYEIRINSGTPTQLGNVTSKTYTALTQAQPYSVSYNVRACNATGCGPWSNVQTVTINPNTTCLNPPCLAAVITPTHTGSGLTPTLSPATATGLGVPALTVDYSYDARGYVDQATRSADGLVYAKVTAMDAYGHVTAATELGGDSLVRGYDQATGLALSTEADNTGGTALVKRSYVFDEFGNLMQRSDLIDGSVEKDDYDALNRLHSSTLILGGASATTTYGYDAAGDITSRSDRGTYTYGGAGPHQVTAISDGSTFAYDADGEMTNDNGTTLTWAAFGKAVQVKTAAGTTLGLAYGPDEGRYQKTVSTSGGASETVLYLGAAEVLTVNGQESVRRSVTVAGLSLIDTGGEDAGVLAVVRGSLGSSVGLVNAAGSLVRAMSYGPYGKRRTAGWAAPMSQDTAWTIDTTETDRGYTGQESLDSVGLDDYNARLYDPKLGRFLSVDPKIGHPESTQGINPYSYVENNPLNRTDPTGEASTTTTCKSNGDGKTETCTTSGPVSQTGSHIQSRASVTYTKNISTGKTSNVSTSGPASMPGGGIALTTDGNSRVTVSGTGTTNPNAQTNPNLHNHKSQSPSSAGGQTANSSNKKEAKTTNKSSFVDHREHAFSSNKKLAGWLGKDGVAIGYRDLYPWYPYLKIPMLQNPFSYTDQVAHEELFYTDSNGMLHNLGYFEQGGIHADPYFPKDIRDYEFFPIGHNIHLDLHPTGFGPKSYDVLHHNCQDYIQHVLPPRFQEW